MKELNKTTVYDWPTRIFHWLFAFLFVVAYVIAETVSDESSLFTLHIMAGLTIGFILVLRIIWGFVGTTYARFSTFELHPIELFDILKMRLFPKPRIISGIILLPAMLQLSCLFALRV